MEWSSTKFAPNCMAASFGKSFYLRVASNFNITFTCLACVKGRDYNAFCYNKCSFQCLNVALMLYMQSM